MEYCHKISHKQNVFVRGTTFSTYDIDLILIQSIRFQVKHHLKVQRSRAKSCYVRPVHIGFWVCAIGKTVQWFIYCKSVLNKRSVYHILLRRVYKHSIPHRLTKIAVHTSPKSFAYDLFHHFNWMFVWCIDEWLIDWRFENLIQETIYSVLIFDKFVVF